VAYPEFQALVKQLEAEGGGMCDANMKVGLVPSRTNSGKKKKQDDSDDSESSIEWIVLKH
jgi:hypothetical protein